MINCTDITLKKFTIENLNDPRYLQWVRDPDVTKYIGRKELTEFVKFEEIQTYVHGLWRNKFCLFLAVYHLKDNDFIGTFKINFGSKDGKENGVADMGIMIGNKSYQGQGLATNILGAASSYAFRKLGARKLVGGCVSRNIPMVKAFESVGYNLEGRLRNQTNLNDGDYCDHVLFGCFRNELKTILK